MFYGRHDRHGPTGGFRVSMSAGLIWPEMLDGDCDEEAEPPEFNNGYDWARWLMNLPGDADVGLEDVGCGALNAIYTDGMDRDEVSWVSPAELLATADRLADLILTGGSDVVSLLAAYEDYSATGTPVDQLVLRELEVVRNMARWAQAQGKDRLAFEIG